MIRGRLMHTMGFLLKHVVANVKDRLLCSSMTDKKQPMQTSHIQEPLFALISSLLLQPAES